MNISVNAKQVSGKVKVISSKSELHRLLILSAFAKEKSKIEFYGVISLDVEATLDCLRAVGAKIKVEENVFIVEPIKELPKGRVKLFCRESGSTLRFILPIFCMLGIEQEITVSGRLKDRPLSPIYEILKENGVNLSNKGEYPLYTKGKFSLDKVEIDGGISSQFISGLLMAFAIANENGKVTVKGDFQSKSYVDITVNAIKSFGVNVSVKDSEYTVYGNEYNGKNLTAYGDWSNGAFFLALGALSGNISVLGLNENSFQGDKKIVNLIKEFGGNIISGNGEITVENSQTKGIEIDVNDIPDLAPVLAVISGVSNGKTTIYNGKRLRLKESDRIKSVVQMINAIGGIATEKEDGMEIIGVKEYTGGVVDSFNDHRIVMASAIASAKCKNSVTIINAEAVNKSYPSFFEELKRLGASVKEV